MAITPEQRRRILQNDFITRTQIMRLFGIGERNAQKIFDDVLEAVKKDGRISLANKIPIRRMYRMLGVPFPADAKVEIIDNRKTREEQINVN